MTDFLYDTYSNRCHNELRQFVKLKKMVQKEDEPDADFSDHPLLMRFKACMFKPFATPELTEGLESCITQHATDEEKKMGLIPKQCSESVKAIEQWGVNHLHVSLQSDLYSNLKMSVTRDRCADYATKAVKKGCHAFPEEAECVQLRQEAFHCIATSPACQEIQQWSNECFLRESRRGPASAESDDSVSSDGLVSGIIKDIFSGSDSATLRRDSQFCHRVRADLFRCFEKYFLLTGVYTKGSIPIKVGPPVTTKTPEKKADAKQP